MNNILENKFNFYADKPLSVVTNVLLKIKTKIKQ